MSRQPKLFAAIDIGSHKLRMKIVESHGDGTFRILEIAEMLIPLGRDTFNDEKLSFDSVKKTCEAIHSFKRLMTDYGVKDYRVVATSAIREASNRDYMIDRIKIQTGFDVEILNTSQEKFLAYKAIKWQAQNNRVMPMNDPTLILNIGAGSIQLLLSENNLLVSSQSLKLGALRIKESIAKIEKHTLNFSRVLEEYIEAHIENVEYLKSSNEITNFVIISSELEYLLTVTGFQTSKGLATLSKTHFEQVYERIMNKTTKMLSEEYDISMADAELFAPSLILMRKFFEKTSSNKIIIPSVTLVDGIIVERFNHFASEPGAIDFDLDILSYVRTLADRYRYNKKHSEYVEHAALMLYDKLSGVHGLGKIDRFLLQVASILHDIGKYIGADPHYVYSYNIINAAQIIGLSDDDLAMVASIARYHSLEIPTLLSAGLNKLDTKHRIRAMKLIAIIRMADALDTSHKQKLKLNSMTVKDDNFVVRAESIEEAVLEHWTFLMKAEFFSEVFGLKPQLIIKNQLL